MSSRDSRSLDSRNITINKMRILGENNAASSMSEQIECSSCTGVGFLAVLCPACGGSPAHTPDGCGQCGDEESIEALCSACSGEGFTTGN